MSAYKVGSESSIDRDESIGAATDVPHDEMTSIRGVNPSTAESDDDGVEITATALSGASIQAIPRINVYENIPFAGGDGDYSILSVLFGPHSIGGGIFGYLNMKDSNNVRIQCVECRKAVMDFPWMDKNSKIKGSVRAWRAAFPYARAVNVTNRDNLVDEDFVHIRGDARVRLHTVRMRRCTRVTDAAFVYLRGIHTLDMSRCSQIMITDAAFVHLRGIQRLDMSKCFQATITDAAFVHLRGIYSLDLGDCNQATITDAAFVHLQGIHTLKLPCRSRTITDAAFVHLRGIHTLDMSFCNLGTITDGAFVHLRGIYALDMRGCYHATIKGATFEHLRGIHTLNMMGCNIKGSAFVHLSGIHTLNMSCCTSMTITDATFGYLRGIHTLHVSGCRAITDAAFVHLQGIHTLYISFQESITAAAFVHLRGIHTLVVGGRCQPALRHAAAALLLTNFSLSTDTEM